MPAEIREALVAHARFSLPEEACGLLAADRGGRLRMAYCLSNVERSAVAFTVDPAEHLGAWRHAERNGWELVGAFHSHTGGDAFPSRTDVARALDPTWLYVIVGLGGPEPEVRAFWIREGEIAEEPVAITGAAP